VKIAHIINPVAVPAHTELGIAQPITFESIRVAHEYAKGKLDVQLYTVSYEEDRAIIPIYFTQLSNLTTSVRDKYSNKKKLPYIKDILQALYDNTDAEYMIYTNMDIALMPQFYVVVQALLQQGHDALLINRRGISTKYKTVAELPMMYADMGVVHPGFDCFVFHRSLLQQFNLAEICIGVPFLEVSLLHNFIAHANNLKLVDDLHLTFHIGTEVMPPVDKDLYLYNRAEYEQKIYPTIKHKLDIKKFPYSELPVYKRLLKWALNPCFRTHQVVEMEGKDFARRIKYKIDTLRFRWMDGIR
jgi:hypothetical protein